MMSKWLVMAIGPSELPYPRVVLMGVDGLLSAKFTCSFHTYEFFCLLQGAGMKGFLKEGIAGAYMVQRLLQIACQSIGFNGQKRQIGERGWLGHLLGSSLNISFEF